jgi:SAM-dependent methyltransferase
MTTDAFNWTRTTSLRSRDDGQEIWTLNHGELVESYDVNVTYGKSIDIKNIKKDWSFKTSVEFCGQARDHFENSPNFVPVDSCPICSADRSKSVRDKRIWNEDYSVCGICGHAFMDHFPVALFAEEFYSKTYSTLGYYTDEEKIELRIAQIYRPKIEWIIERYRSKYGRNPKTVFDVGAGTGHSLFAAKQLGISAHGVERDEYYRKFCKENFDIDLYGSPDEYSGEEFDVVMSFNVIEHVDDPFQFLAEYKSLLSSQPLAVVETPKYNSITSEVQAVFKDKIRGHLMPYQHSHMFSDSSLATLFYLNGYDISDIWIFGNDAVEVILQITDDLDVPSEGIIESLFPALQRSFDQSLASDIMVFAAVPAK